MAELAEDSFLEDFERELRRLISSDVEFIRLIEEDLVYAGGKRIRPRLAYLASRALDPDGVPHEMRLALAVELLHSATLLHDDLVDGAETRRGKEAAYRRYGNAVSVLSGDFLLSRLLYALAQTEKLELVRIFAEVARELSEAEVLQFQAAALFDWREEVYYRVIRGKTAALMQAATEGPAVLLGLGPEDERRRALAEFGEAYGLAFQLRDDYLDLMGDPELLGKPVGGDLKEGKVTLILLKLLEKGGEAAREAIFRRGEGEGDLELLRRLARETGAAQEVVAAIGEQVERAERALSALPPSPARERLLALARAELGRVG